MMKRRMIVTAASVAVLATGLLGACGSSSNSAGNTIPTGAGCKPITLQYWNAYSTGGAEVKTLTGTIIPAFEKANPCIKVNNVVVPYDQLHQKLITATAGSVLPDLVRSDIIWVPELANLGVLAPLDQQLPDFATLSKEVFPGNLATNKWNGHYYGLPLDTNTLNMLYSKSTFTKLGLPVPTTYAQLWQEAPQMKAKGVTAYVDTGLSSWNILPMIWSYGGEITDPNVTKATGYLNSANTVKAVTDLFNAYKAGYVGKNITNQQDPSKAFAAGQIAMEPGGPWMFPIFKGSYPNFDVSAQQMLSGPGGSISVVGGEDIVMTNASKNKAAAEKFIDFSLSEEAQMALAKVGQMPVLTSLSDQLNQLAPYYATFTEQLKTSKSRPASPAYAKIDQLLGNTLAALITKGGDVQTTMNSLASQVDALLAQYPQSNN